MSKTVKEGKLPAITIGCDPELFLRDHLGTYHSAHTYIMGSKALPVPVACGAVQVDGVAAEFNIHPASNREEWRSNIEVVIHALRGMLDADPIGQGLELTAIPTAFFDPKYFAALPAEVRRLGCTPDFNAYTDGAANPEPDASRTYRTGGGHIHVGWTSEADVESDTHIFDCIQAAKQLDCAIWLPSLLFDSDRQRQTLYGQKGCFRPKVYGFEYRSPSNAWLKDPALVDWVFDSTMEAMNMMLDSRFTDNFLFNIPEFRHGLETKLDDFTRPDLLYLHDQLVGWGFPKLPDAYLEA